MGEWKEHRLGDIVELRNGKARPNADGTIPIYGGNGILGYTNSNNSEGEVVVIGRVGAYCGSVYFENRPIWVSDNALFALPKDSFDTRFLYYFLKDLNLNSVAEGSSHPLLTQILLNSLEVNVTDDPVEQRAIASVLSSLDDKIDLLHRQNKTLEATARSLFRQWFVEEQNKSTERAKISELAEINSCVLSAEYPYPTILYLDTGSITRGTISGFQSYPVKQAPSRAQRIVHDGDIVYSLVRPIQRHYGILHDIKPNTIVSTGFCVVTCRDINAHFIYLLLTNDDAVEYFDTVAEGSTSAYPSLRPSDISDYVFPKPDERKLREFTIIASDIWKKINANQNQMNALTEMRNTLLPKLMSGEVRIKGV